jgi:ribose-phosphate pyrophosphokinase
LIGDLKNKHVFIIDDMIDTAGTICNAARTAMDNGAQSVVAIATHPVLSGPAVSRLQEAPIKKIIVSDTINIDKNKLFDKLEIISVAAVFSEAIIRINKGDSISELFK